MPGALKKGRGRGWAPPLDISPITLARRQKLLFASCLLPPPQLLVGLRDSEEVEAAQELSAARPVGGVPTSYLGSGWGLGMWALASSAALQKEGGRWNKRLDPGRKRGALSASLKGGGLRGSAGAHGSGWPEGRSEAPGDGAPSPAMAAFPARCSRGGQCPAPPAGEGGSGRGLGVAASHRRRPPRPGAEARLPRGPGTCSGGQKRRESRRAGGRWAAQPPAFLPGAGARPEAAPRAPRDDGDSRCPRPLSGGLASHLGAPPPAPTCAAPA